MGSPVSEASCHPLPSIDTSVEFDDLKSLSKSSLFKIFKELYDLCLIRKKGEQRDLERLYYLSTKIANFASSKQVAILESTKIDLLETTLKALNVKHQFARKSEDKKAAIETCHILKEQLAAPVKGWFLGSKITHLRKEILLLETKLENEISFLELQDQFLKLESALNESIDRIGEQTEDLENGDRLDYSPQSLEQLAKRLTDFFDFYNDLENKLKGKELAQLAFYKAGDGVIQSTLWAVEEFLETYQKELSFELQKLKNPSDEYTYLLYAQNKVQEIAFELKQKLSSYLEPKPNLGKIQAWTATLFSIPQDILQLVLHPINSLTPTVSSELKKKKNQFQNFLQHIIHLCPHSSTKLENTKELEPIILQAREITKRSISQQQIVAQERKIARQKNEGYSRSSKVLMGLLGLFAVGSFFQWGNFVYKESTTLKERADGLQKAVLSQLSTEQQETIIADAARLERFLVDYWPKNPVVDRITKWAGFRGKELLQQFTSRMFDMGRLELSNLNTSSIVDEFKTWMAVGQSTLSSTLSLEQWWKVFTTCQEKPFPQNDDIATSLPHEICLPNQEHTCALNATSTENIEVVASIENNLEENSELLQVAKIEAESEELQVQKAILEFEALNKQQLTSDKSYTGNLTELLRHPFVIDKRTLGNLVGDSFLSQTGLEGAYQDEVANLFLQFSRFHESLNTSYFPASKLSAMLEKSLAFDDIFTPSIETVENERAALQAAKLLSITHKTNHPLDSRLDLVKFFTSGFKKFLLELIPDGDPLLVSGGWTDLDGGHAMNYEFYRQADDKYTLKIFNRGAGTRYHFRHVEDGKHKIIPIVEKRNINLKDLLDPVFIQGFYEIRGMVLNRDAQGLRLRNEEIIYKSLFSKEILPGDLAIQEKDKHNWVEPQKSGTCAYQSLLMVVEDKISLPAFHRFELELGLVALDHYSRNFIFLEADRDLLEKSLHAYSSTLCHYLKLTPQIFSAEELTLIYSHLKKIEDKIQKINSDEKWAILNGKFDVVSTSNSQLVELNSELMAKNDEVDIQNDLKSGQVTLLSYRNQNYLDYDPIQLLNNLDFAIKDLHNLQQVGYISYSFEVIHQIIYKIKGIDFSQFSHTEKKKFIPYLSQITQILYDNVKIENGKIYPRNYLSVLQTSKILYEMVDRKLAEELGLPYPLDFLFMGFEATKSPFFLITDPAMLKEFQEFEKFLKSKDIPKLIETPKYSLGNSQNLEQMTLKNTGIKGEGFLAKVWGASIVNHLYKSKTPINSLLNAFNSLVCVGKESATLLIEEMSEVWKALIKQGILAERLANGFIHSGDSQKKDINIDIKLSINQEADPQSGVSQITVKGKFEYYSSSISKFSSYLQHSKWGPLFTSNYPLGFIFDKMAYDEGIDNPFMKAMRFWLSKLFIAKSQLFDHYKNEESEELCLAIEEPLLRIQRIINFFSSPLYNGQLSKTQYQLFLSMALFHQDALSKAFSSPVEGPILAEQLSQFINGEITKLINNEDYAVFSYFIKLHRQIKALYESVRGKTDSIFINQRQLLEKILALPQLQPYERAQLNLEKLALLLENPSFESIEEVKELLSTYFYYQTQKSQIRGEEKNLQLSIHENEVLEKYRHVLFSIRKDIEKKSDEILNHLASFYGNDFSSQDKWEIDQNHSFPIFSCSEKKAYLDIASGKFLRSGHEVVSCLPHEIISSDQYTNVFGAKCILATKIHENLYQVSAEDGYEYLIIKLEQKVQIQKKIQGEWHFLKENLLSSNLNFKDGYSHWMKVKSLEDNQSNPLEQFYIFKNDQPEPIFHFNGQELLYLPTGHLLISPNDPSCAFVTSFEDSQYINVFKDAKTQQITCIEFPRIQIKDGNFLEFNLKDQKLHCKNYPGLYLSTKRDLIYPNYNILLLEDIYGQPIKALISPFLLDKPNTQKQTKTGLDKDHDLKFPNSKKNNCFEYDVSKGSSSIDLNLIPRSKEEAFYLTLTHLRAHAYQKAYEILHKEISSLRGMVQKEKKLLKEILILTSKNMDRDPRGYAVKLLAGYLLVNNELCHQRELQKDDVDFFNELKEVYEKYLQLRPFTQPFDINPYYELEILYYLEGDLLSDILPSRRLELQKELQFLSTLPPSVPGSLFETFSAKDEVYKINLSYLSLIIEEASPDLDTWDRVQKWFSKAKEILTTSTAPDISSFSFTAPLPQDLLALFPTLYKDAKEWRANSEKATYNPIKLAHFFQYYKHTNSGIGKLFKDVGYLLEWVARFPESFPSVEQIGAFDLTKKKDVDECIKLLENAATDFMSQHKEVVSGQNSLQQLLTIDKPVPKKVESRVVKTKAPLKLTISSKDSSLSMQMLDKIIRAQTVGSGKKSDEQARFFVPEKVTEPFYLKEFQEIEEDYHIYLKSDKGTSYQLKENVELEDLNQLEVQILKEIGSAREKLTEKKSEILKLANKSLSDEGLNSIKKIGKIARAEKELTEDDLFLIFLQNDALRYKEANEGLTSQEITLLHHKVADYLIDLVELQKVERFRKILKQIINASVQERGNWVQKLGECGYSKRSYDVSKNPAYLVFEYYADITLYPKQIAALDKLKKSVKIEGKRSVSPGYILEAIMGFGKSMVITPLLALWLANKENAPIVVMPDSLIESLGAEMQFIGSRFQQRLKLIEFNRQTKCSKGYLEHIEVLLKSAVDNREVIIFSGSSIKSLFLKYLETLHRQDKDLIVPFQKIFRFLNMSTLPIFDEADLLFNCRQETHFSLDKSSQIASEHLDLSILVYQILIENSIMRLDFLDSESSNIFTETLYKEKYQPQIAKKLVEKLAQESLGLNELKSFMTSLTPEQKKLLEHYFSGHFSVEIESLLHSISNEKVANVITLAQAQLNIFFPLTLNKKIFEHYGVQPSSSKPALAIPYHQGKPSVNSEFGTPYEIIFYTTQYYLKHGISFEIVKNQINILKAELMKLWEKFPQLNYRQLSQFQKMLQYCPESIRDSIGLNFKDEEISQMVAYINSRQDLKLAWIRDFFLSQVEIYNQRISTNPQLYRHLFSDFVGFTGTMWNSETFPENIEVEKSAGILGNTLFQVLKKSNPNIVIIESEDDALSQLPALIQNQHAYIDLSGYFDSTPSEKVCERILESRPDIEAVAYYNNQNSLMILKRGDQKPVLFAKSELKDLPHIRFTYYSHQYATGADVSQAPSARARVSIGRHTRLRDFEQAIWRMRGLEKDQAVDFVITKQDRQVMLKELGLPIDHSLTLENLIAYCALYQQKIKASDNLLSQKQKIHAVLEKYALKQLFANDPEDVLNFFEKISSLFISKVFDQPGIQYSQPQELQDCQIILLDYIDTLTKTYKEHFQNWSEIRKEMEQVIDLGALPQKLLVGKNTIQATGQEIKIETETRQELKTETKKETEIEKEQEQARSYSCQNKPMSWKALLNPDKPPVQADDFLPKVGEYQMTIPELDEISWTARIDFLMEQAFNFSPQIFSSLNLKFRLHELFDKLECKSKLSINFRPDIFAHLLIRGESCTTIGQEVLMVQSATGLKLLLLEIHEAAEWKDYIQKMDEQGHHLSMWLVNIQSGEIKRSEKMKSIAEVEKSLEYQELIVQANLIYGNIFFNREQIAVLEKWMGKNQITKSALKKFIKDKSLQGRELSRAAFANSALGEFLNAPSNEEDDYKSSTPSSKGSQEDNEYDLNYRQKEYKAYGITVRKIENGNLSLTKEEFDSYKEYIIQNQIDTACLMEIIKEKLLKKSESLADYEHLPLIQFLREEGRKKLALYSSQFMTKI